ncbi:MAG: Holliday junction branch migration protein RuvA [Alphaproteobacteria bacterium]|nr:Holliday junction branch migration protein RuvA [Alphaproteobacteria bacterium]
MIAKLRGIIDTIGEDYCIIDVNGVGYLVAASAKTLGKLVVGTETTLLTETVVREDSISLFGFADAWEKEWFNTLTKVQGVGAKVCLSILSVLTPVQLSQAIGAQDKTSFCRASGVGPKLAARIVTELKDKIVTVPVNSNNTDVLNDTGTTAAPIIPSAPADYSKSDDVISALVNLGYQRLEAYHAVSRVIAENPDANVPTLIRLSLKEFANKEF